MKRGFKLAALVFAGALALGACSGDDDDDDAASDDASEESSDVPEELQGVELTGEDRDEVLTDAVANGVASIPQVDEEQTACLQDYLLENAPDSITVDYATSPEFGEVFGAALDECGVGGGGETTEEEPVEEEVEE
jgi:ABC-type glycerol-3-phosphate transport system substrate-binding protein